VLYVCQRTDCCTACPYSCASAGDTKLANPDAARGLGAGSLNPLARDFEEKLMALETVLLGVVILLLVGANIYSRTR
jgi:hypothetical protein